MLSVFQSGRTLNLDLDLTDPERLKPSVQAALTHGNADLRCGRKHLNNNDYGVNIVGRTSC